MAQQLRLRILQRPEMQRPSAAIAKAMPCLFNTVRGCFEVMPGEFSVHFILDVDKEVVKQFKSNHHLLCTLMVDQTAVNYRRFRPTVALRRCEGTISKAYLYQPVQGYYHVRKLEFAEIKVMWFTLSVFSNAFHSKSCLCVHRMVKRAAQESGRRLAPSRCTFHKFMELALVTHLHPT